MACVEGCEELARELEEACYLEEHPRRCLREARREINACFESCVEMDHRKTSGHTRNRVTRVSFLYQKIQR